LERLVGVSYRHLPFALPTSLHGIAELFFKQFLREKGYMPENRLTIPQFPVAL
jgi:hypothetical protein